MPSLKKVGVTMSDNYLQRKSQQGKSEFLLWLTYGLSLYLNHCMKLYFLSLSHYQMMELLIKRHLEKDVRLKQKLPIVHLDMI